MLPVVQTCLIRCDLQGWPLAQTCDQHRGIVNQSVVSTDHLEWTSHTLNSIGVTMRLERQLCGMQACCLFNWLQDWSVHVGYYDAMILLLLHKVVKLQSYRKCHFLLSFFQLLSFPSVWQLWDCPMWCHGLWQPPWSTHTATTSMLCDVWTPTGAAPVPGAEPNRAERYGKITLFEYW